MNWASGPSINQLEHRAEAHILIAFLAYGLHVTLRNRRMIHAPGLTPAAVLEKLATIPRVEVWTDGGWSLAGFLPRHTQPERDVQALLCTTSTSACPPNQRRES